MDIAEGKTKIIRATKDPYEVLIVSKDGITAGDGARRHVIHGKGKLATATTSNVFKALAPRVPTHFLRRVNATTFRARKCRMIPVEVVVRRLAYGSYCKRHPDVAAGTRLPSLVVEYYLKDDARHDPLIRFDGDLGRWKLHDAKKPVGPIGLGDVPSGIPGFGPGDRERAVESRIRGAAMMAFEILEAAWSRQDVTLVDLKVEFGIDAETGVLLVADVIDNDSWRIWPGGDPARMVDKQVYRNLLMVTPETLNEIGEKYAWVADATAKFLAAE